jgi:DNA-binding MarR family transcriptional regulator
MQAAPDPAECRNCLCLASRSAARGITAVYDRHLRPYGVRITQFTILVMLMLRGGTAISVLAKALGMDRTTLTRNVGLLDTNGWVQSQTDGDDARTRIIAVTPKGRAVVRAALPAWRKAQDEVATALGRGGVAALRRLARTTIQ